MDMATGPLPTLTPLPVLIRSSGRAPLDGAGTLFTTQDTEITGLHVVSREEALIRLKRAHPDVRRVCIGVTMLQRAQKDREWPVFQEAVDIVRKWVPHFWGDAEIESLRSGLSGNLRVEPHPYLKVGKRVRVRSGPMAGMEGIMVRRKEKFRVVLSIHLIQRSVAVEVDESEVEPVH